MVGERHDATHLPLVTIDPEGARDIDQAVHLESSPQGQRIYYAIADVGAHVVPGGALDRDTRDRVETIYCPDKRVGLHPPQMSEGFASLLPGQRTKAVLDAGRGPRRQPRRFRRASRLGALASPDAYHELATSPRRPGGHPNFPHLWPGQLPPPSRPRDARILGLRDVLCNPGRGFLQSPALAFELEQVPVVHQAIQ